MELKGHHHVCRHKITELGYKGVSKCLRQMPLQSHLNTTLLITNILKVVLIHGAGVVQGVSRYGGGVVREDGEKKERYKSFKKVYIETRITRRPLCKRAAAEESLKRSQ